MSLPAALALVILPLHAPVELRGGQTVIAPIVDISPDGVQVGGDEPRVIAWDNVRAVDAEWADRAAPYEQVSDDAWRARTRLARGDTALAAPLFEKLFPQYREEDGSLALMIAEGVYRCRYGQGDIAGACEAWLVAADLRERGVEIAGDPPMTPLLDPETHLPPKTPPLFIQGADATRVANATAQWLDRASPDTPPRMRHIVRAYHQAAQRAALPDAEVATDLPLPDEPGPRLVALIVNAESPNPQTRQSSRDALAPYCRADAQGTWREAWARAAIGRSLIMEDDRDQRLAGVIELLHLPARFADSNTNLAAIALAQAAQTLRALGDRTSSVHLIEELQALAPEHQALAWLREQDASPTSPAASTTDGDNR